ncbi:glutamate receptor-like [Palaemon carinicauda]|uniref:glutamate receptor-like n=1 Tax=Palaemon carinicauda TaxID=392227 RepID=UPI0035B5DFDF
MMASTRGFITVAFEEFQPYGKLQNHSDGSLQYTGPMANFLAILADKINVDYDLKQPTDHIYGGYKDVNGSWSGTIGQVQRKEAEFFLGPSSIDPYWGQEFEYTTPIYTESNVLLMKRPTVVRDMANFLKPFAAEVWFCIISSFVCVVFVLTILTKFENRFLPMMSKSSFFDVLLWATSTFSQENSGWVPKANGGRVLTATWLITSLIFMSSYAGILTAMLTVPIVVIPIDSKYDLVKQTAMPWKLRAGSFIRQYFRDSELEVDRKLFAGAGEFYGNCWHSREEIRNGEFVAVCVSNTARTIMAWDFSATAKCHTYMAKEKVYTMNHGVVVFKPNSSYIQTANMIILRLHQAGLLNKWLTEEASNATHCLQPPGSQNRDGNALALNIPALSGPFVLLSVGLTGGIVSFLMELVVFYTAES